MKLSKFSVIKLKIPFKMGFKHSSAERRATQSILVVAESKEGLRGVGEGCPREYVTHETVETAIAFFETHREQLIDKIHSLETLKHWLQEHELLIDQNPAAWCAIELALLDLLAKENNHSLEKLLGLPELKDAFQYSAVIGDAPTDQFIDQANQYLAMGFRDFKIKISGEVSRDRERIAYLQNKSADTLYIRVDANNLWQNSREAIVYFNQLDTPLVAIEEPLYALQFDQLAEVAKAIKTPIILDESFLNKSHFAPIRLQTSAFIINIRISKMGGLLRSLEISGQADTPIIIGAQVGETSILTRAALTVANTHNPMAQEGAFGTYLLKYDLVHHPLMFQAQGLLSPRAFLTPDEHGLQLAYHIDRFTK